MDQKNKNLSPTPTELRKFGLAVGGVFMILFGLILPWILNRPWPRWPWIVGGPLFFFALVYPPALRIPHKIWMALGLALNWINTRIILGLLFFGIFTPIAFIMKLMRRDPMARGFEKQLDTYRVSVKESALHQMERPF